MTRPRVLLTGFGPFPGFPINASAAFVKRLADASRLEAEVTALVLPTEWLRGVAEAQAGLARYRPDIALHFGVADSARGFVVEAQAHNVCDALPDACGGLPAGPQLAPDGPPVRHARLPVEGIMGALRAARIPVARSNSAGTYLCNALLYASLGCDVSAPLTGFIHIPRIIGAPGPLSDEQALTGGQFIIQACLSVDPGSIKTCG